MSKFRLQHPLKGIKKFKIRRLSIFLLLTILFLMPSSCNKEIQKNTQSKEENSFNLTREERIWMNDFFTGIMLQKEGIYTLYGSKPMVMFPVDCHTDEEKKALWEECSKEKKNTIYSVKDYHLAANWQKWEAVRDRFPMNRYLFFKKNHPDQEKCLLICFVDILKLATTLQKYYGLFYERTGIDFDPIIEVFEIEKGSNFWDQVFADKVLIGLVLGYGLNNSLCLDWRFSPDESFKKLADCWRFKFSNEPQEGEATLDRLSLPTFPSFFDIDEMIENYEQERLQIKIIYKNKNFLDQTLLKLTY